MATIPSSSNQNKGGFEPGISPGYLQLIQLVKITVLTPPYMLFLELWLILELGVELAVYSAHLSDAVDVWIKQ